MKNSSFYDLASVSFCDRETFNNVILLLSMVKSEAYYIVGFSRIEKRIEIGFDFIGPINSTITQTLVVDLNTPDRIFFKAILKDLNRFKNIIIPDNNNNNFYYCGTDIIYERNTKRDKIIPTSIENIDKCIKDVKKEIIEFIEDQL